VLFPVPPVNIRLLILPHCKEKRCTPENPVLMILFIKANSREFVLVQILLQSVAALLNYQGKLELHSARLLLLMATLAEAYELSNCGMMR
jgi:hypothetical protein